MSAPRPLELDYLALTESAIALAISKIEGNRFEARLQILEACSARFGGFGISSFHGAFKTKALCEESKLLELSAPVIIAIEQSKIHPSLALSALAREPLNESDRKRTGAYHTDFRLANRVAELAAPRLTYKSRVVDPACGAGILLVALSIVVCGRDRAKISEWLANGVCAADLSENSLRAALLSLASLTDDIDALVKMRARWFCGDSLLAERAIWEKMAPEGFDAVVGNPPWEKVKLTRHEFSRALGSDRHYGDYANDTDEAQFNERRNSVAHYSQRLLSRYPDLACGEPDLYIAFTSLFFDMCKPNGVVAALVPGGLIRSQGTTSVRKKLFESSKSISISIIDNRARFFAIDTRFKFLAVVLTRTGKIKEKREPIILRHEKGTPMGLESTGSAVIGRTTLLAIRDDLSVPEVRSQAEWSVFRKMSEAGCTWDDPVAGWSAKFCREVDMTKERPLFLSSPTKTSLPVIEGRMVHHHRFGVKGYVSGSGRRAVWESKPVGESVLRPQFWIEPKHIPVANKEKTERVRAGFCDIAGQTNERSLMASIIPAGVVCGNKVPTISFTTDPSLDRLLVWTAIANSIPFDWMLRRVLTTTVNYFLLQSIRLPRLSKGGLPWQKILTCAKELNLLDRAGASKATKTRMAHLRAEIDAEVAIAYGLEHHELELMTKDFPILDRGQPPLSGELKSTITCDTMLAVAAKKMNVTPEHWVARVKKSSELGAHPYIPSEVADDEATLIKAGLLGENR